LPAGFRSARRRALSSAISRHNCRRIARSGLRERRVNRSASPGVISPRPIAAATLAIAPAISPAVRMREKSMPSRSPGSGRRAGGKIRRATGSSR
jgi:hypothetical protein